MKSVQLGFPRSGSRGVTSAGRVETLTSVHSATAASRLGRLDGFAYQSPPPS
jgi:hypothetical protein